MRTQQWTTQRRLPPVLPIVLYNGGKRWDAPEDIGDLIVHELQEVRTMLADRWAEWEEEWKQEGLHKGLQQGRQEGWQEGEAAVVLLLLKLKFGVLPGDVEEKVRQADAETLLLWRERAGSDRDGGRGHRKSLTSSPIAVPTPGKQFFKRVTDFR